MVGLYFRICTSPKRSALLCTPPKRIALLCVTKAESASEGTPKRSAPQWAHSSRLRLCSRQGGVRFSGLIKTHCSLVCLLIMPPWCKRNSALVPTRAHSAHQSGVRISPLTMAGLVSTIAHFLRLRGKRVLPKNASLVLTWPNPRSNGHG